MLAVSALAADLEVTAYVNRTTAGINDNIQYTIELSGSDAKKIGTPKLPKLDGFNQGVSTSSVESRTTLVNGRFESSLIRKYQYSLSPKSLGKITIPSITIKYKKRSYQTEVIHINVIQGSNDPTPSSGKLLEVTSYVNRTTVGINDNIQYTIEISGSGTNEIGTPKLPKLDGFNNQGVSTSSSSSTTMVNGSYETVVIKKYLYSLSPKRLGKITIPSITIEYKKKSYQTEVININVIKGSNDPTPSSDKRNDNIFIDIQVSDKNPYQNEAVEVTYTLYSKYNVTSLSFNEEPSFIDFWKEEVFTPKKMNIQRTTRNGEIFNSMKLKTYAIFPSKSGDISVDSLKVDVDIQSESSYFQIPKDKKKYHIASDPVSFSVQELPAGAPSDFTNALGMFNLNSSISKTSLKVGDSFTYTLEISGRGNISNIDIATLPEIIHLRFSDPETSTEINSSKVNGKKVIRYLVIAQEPGNFTIPSLTFSYFDPDKNKYTTLRSDKYVLNVQDQDNKDENKDKQKHQGDENKENKEKQKQQQQKVEKSKDEKEAEQMLKVVLDKEKEEMQKEKEKKSAGRPKSGKYW